MKKTIIALLALSGMACAGEFVSQDITFSTTNSFDGTNGGTYSGVVFNLGNVSSALVTQTPATAEVTKDLGLDSITIHMRNNNGTAATGTYYLYVIDAETKAIVAQSTNTQTTFSPSQGQPLTFTFSDVVLDSATTYAARFVASNSTSSVVAADGTYDTSVFWSVLLGVAKAQTGGLTANWGVTSKANVTSNHDNFSPVMSIATHTVVPEPATATLSLLALAGLAARRRRH